MKVVTSAQIREMDRKAIELFGMPGSVLMENAGAAVAEVIMRRHPALIHGTAAVFCGSGNNGGDGFVIARRLALLGVKVHVCLAAPIDSIKNDARIHLAILLKVLPPDCFHCDSEHWASVLKRTDIVVDALLGTGLKGNLAPGYADAVRLINLQGLPVYSVDIPSGVDSDAGSLHGDAVNATCTVTFAYPKLGMYLFPGAAHTGEIIVSDIGFDWDRVEVENAARLFFPTSDLISMLQKRNQSANKGEYGHLGIVAGSRGMAGAPALAARAAQRVGAGLVTVLTASCIQQTLAAKLDEQMTIPLADSGCERGAMTLDAYTPIAKFAEKAAAFAIGPGMTTAPETGKLVQRLLAEIDHPIVLDADGLNCLSQRPDCIELRTFPLIITPHPGEAARLLETTVEIVEADRVSAVRALAEKYDAIALLKGAYTLIADPDGEILINTTGNPGMATGGSGDILTGILGGLLAQYAAAESHGKPFGFSLLELTAFAAYLHGRAGDLAAEEMGVSSMNAGDIISHIPKAILGLKESP